MRIELELREDEYRWHWRIMDVAGMYWPDKVLRAGLARTNEEAAEAAGRAAEEYRNRKVYEI